MEPPRLDLTAIKERQQQAWASGDYAMFGAALRSTRRGARTSRGTLRTL